MPIIGIGFDPSGRILSANASFCRTLGYDLSEVEGRHHSISMLPEEAASPECRAFWARLGRGECDACDYRGIAKDGREIWTQVSYKRVTEKAGRVVRVVRQATDITVRKIEAAETRPDRPRREARRDAPPRGGQHPPQAPAPVGPGGAAEVGHLGLQCVDHRLEPAAIVAEDLVLAQEARHARRRSAVFRNGTPPRRHPPGTTREESNGHRLEHDFGHGKRNLAMMFAALKMLAFAVHTVCDCLERFRIEARTARRAWRRFFEHIRTITAYLVFPDWNILIQTLIGSKPPPDIEARIAR